MAETFRDPAGRSINRVLAQNEDSAGAEPAETDEEVDTRQNRNLDEITRSFAQYQNDPQRRKILEDEFAKGLGIDFPAGSTLTGARISKTNGSQAQVREVDNAIAKNQPFPRFGRDSQVPNTQMTSFSADDTVTRGVEAYKGFVEQSRAVIDDLIRTVATSTEDAANMHTAAGVAVLKAGEANADAERTTGMIDAAAAGTRERILKIANLNSSDAGNAFAKSLAERMQIREKRTKLGDEIDEKMSVGLFDNPLQWLINQTVLPGQVATYNGLARKENDSIHLVEALQSEVKRQEELDLGATSDLYLTRSISIANAKSATASAQSSQLKAEAGSLRAAKAMNIASLLERRMAQQENLSKWEITLAERKEGAQLKADAAADIKDKDEKVKKVGAMVGNNLASFKWLQGQGKDVQEEWAKRAGSGNLGDDFAESFAFIKRFGDLNNMRAGGLGEFADMQRAFQQTVTSRAQEIQDTWMAKHPENAKVPNRKEAEYLASRDMEIEWTANKEKNMFNASQYNPYKVNHKVEFLKYKGDKGNPVYQMVQDAYKSGQLVDDKTLVDATQELVKQGVLHPREAANALAEYYNDAISRNNGDRYLTLMGLDRQKNYNIRPEGSVAPIDLTNPVVTENYLTQRFMLNRVRAGIPGMEFLQNGPEDEFDQQDPDFKRQPEEKKLPPKDTMVEGVKKRAVKTPGVRG